MINIFIEEPFMRWALAAGLLTGGICAYLGVFVVLKRIVFMGMVLSQVAALGIALGLFIGLSPPTVAFALTLAATVFFWSPFGGKTLSKEAVLGFAYALSASLAVILVAKNPLAKARGVNLISGNLLYPARTDLVLLTLACVVVAAVHVFMFRRFVFVSFDKEAAAASGMRAEATDLMLYLTIGIVISLAVRIGGALHVFGALVIPAMTGLVTGRSIGAVFASAVLFSFFGVTAGLALSYAWDLPSGLLIVAVHGAVFLAALSARAAFNRA